jgi:ubiquinone/menaquinone biosynthesis C-methylase UbiE
LRLWRAGEPLPFGGEEFDVVTMTAVLEHLDNPGEVLTECYRVLRPGGRLLLTTPSPLAKPVLEFLAFRLGLISRREITDHKYYFSKRELRQLLGDIGFATPVVRYWQLGFNLFAVAEKPSLPSLL